MSRDDRKILFLGKAGEETSSRAAVFLRQQFPEAAVIEGQRGDGFPEWVRGASFDYVISYLSPWIVPRDVLSATRRAAINFHPGPPEYPGIGCTNFAIYDRAAEFGVTCHHMVPVVDSGAIIAVRRFPIHANDSVLTITQRCYIHIAEQFYQCMDMLIGGNDFPVSPEKWARKALTRKQFNELLILRRDMSADEISLRIRATTFPGYPAARFVEDGEGA